MSGYVLLPEAFNDLDEIRDFIAQENIDAADRVLDEIHRAIQSLAKNPGLGHQRPDLASRPLHFWLVYSYLIAYLPERPLVIIGVLHGRRNPKILSAILNSRESMR